MTVMGTVKNGVIVVDSNEHLVEGSRVAIELAPELPGSITLNDLLELNLRWDEAYSGEFHDIYNDLQREKWKEVQGGVDRGVA